PRRRSAFACNRGGRSGLLVVAERRVQHDLAGGGRVGEAQCLEHALRRSRQGQQRVGPEAEAAVVARLAEHHAAVGLALLQQAQADVDQARAHAVALVGRVHRHQTQHVPAIAIARGPGHGEGDMAGYTAIDVGHQAQGQGAVIAQRLQGAVLQAAPAGRFGERLAHHRADGLDVPVGFLADPHGASLRVQAGTGWRAACWRPAYGRGGERQVMPRARSSNASGRTHGARPPASTAGKPQWRKWRTPVNTMAMPCSSAAAITSASRIEPPGWITALMPAWAAASMPSRNGKNASEAITEPSTTRPASPALMPAMRAE